MSKLDEFDPNVKKGPKAPRWASFIPSRSTAPKFKIHMQRNHALNAFSDQPDGILYEWVDGKWVERVRFEGWEKSPTCDDCGTNLLVKNANKWAKRYGPGFYNRGYTKWVEDADGALRVGTFCLDDVRKRNRERKGARG